MFKFMFIFLIIVASRASKVFRFLQNLIASKQLKYYCEHDRFYIVLYVKILFMFFKFFNTLALILNRIHRSNIKSYEETQYHITIGFRASYDTSRDMPTNDITRFRRINRITVAGRSDVAMQVCC